MAGVRYTIEQLFILRDSPLVRKPDALPSIEQWLDQPQQDQQQQNQRKSRTQNGRTEEATPMGNFTSQRPSLLQTRTTSRAAGTGDDVVLGPPKISFASSRNITKLSDFGEKATTPSEEKHEDDAAATSRSRFFRDRESTRNGTSTKGEREDRESWTAGRRTGGRGNGDDEDRNGERERFGGRRERNTTDQEETGARRNGFGQRLDQKWSRDGERVAGKTGDTQRGWREREKRNERDWERGGQVEKDPEWMDEPLEKEDKNQMKTQEDFERWKERMRAGNAAPETKDENIPQEAATPVKTTKTATPMVLEGGFDKLFGTWGDNMRLDSPAEPPKPAKTPAGKGKSSRFASMFAPKDEPRQDEPMSPALLQAAANGSSEDKEGFARIMQMLGKTTMASTPDETAPPSKDGGFAALFSGGATTQRSRPASYAQTPQEPSQGMFDKKPASTQQNRPESGFGADSFFAPQRTTRTPLNATAAKDTASKMASPDPARMRSNEPPQQHHRPQDMQAVFMDQPPRNVPTPTSLNIQQILAGQQPQKTGSLNKDSAFLLNLINAKNASRPAPEAARPQQQEPDNFQLFLDQPPKMQTHAPKPQAPRPPGLVEEQLFKSGQQPHEQMREPQQNQGQQRQRPPPGFFDDPSILSPQNHRGPYPSGNDLPPQQARRQSAAQPPHHLNMAPSQGLPQNYNGISGPPPGFAFMPDTQMPPPGMPDQRLPPPPGFNPNMRHPPGFAGMPNIFQQPTSQPPSSQQPQQQQRDGQSSQIHHQHQQHMPSLPPGFPPLGMAPPPGFGGPPIPPQMAPPGFFANGPPPPQMAGLAAFRGQEGMQMHGLMRRGDEGQVGVMSPVMQGQGQGQGQRQDGQGGQYGVRR